MSGCAAEMLKIDDRPRGPYPPRYQCQRGRTSQSRKASETRMTQSTQPTVWVFGAGYVGITAAAVFAAKGARVHCLEANPRRRERILAGQSPIEEPGLQPLVAEAVADGRLTVAAEVDESAPDCDLAFYAIGTPEGADGRPEVGALTDAIIGTLPRLAKASAIIVKSTVPIGYAAEVRAKIRAQGSSIAVLSNPEFLAQGTAVRDFEQPDRVVLGAKSEVDAQPLVDLYKATLGDDTPVLVVSNEAAEMIKYAANAMLAARLAFVNELASLAAAYSIDPAEVLSAVGADNRIGPKYLKPGPGFGGSCLPKDVMALSLIAKGVDVRLPVLQSILPSNNDRSSTVVDTIWRSVGKTSKREIALLGLTFKAGTDDLRCSPAVDVANELVARGFVVRAYDPLVPSHPPEVDKRVSVVSSIETAVAEADAVVVATEWSEFADQDWSRLALSMHRRLLIDTRNCIPQEKASAAGFIQVAIGDRGAADAAGKALRAMDKATSPALDPNSIPATS